MLGINFIGDLTGNGSLSETARTTLETIQRQQIKTAYIELRYEYDAYRDNEMVFPMVAQLSRGHHYAVNVINYNVHAFPTLSPERLATLKNGRYTIGNWVWEMPQVPDVFLDQFNRVDEIWVPSGFTQKSFQAVTQTPVHVVPHTVEVPVSGQPDRQRFNLPPKRYIFLFTFSMLSGDGRKNPWATIEAYRKAFGKPTQAEDAPLLVLKSQHTEHYPEMVKPLLQQLEGVGGLLVTDTYTRQEMNDFLNAVDAYVSLHRAEGFGLGMAEAMYLGKPVIATNYSGNTQFMTEQNSYPVRYTVENVTAEAWRYRPDMLNHYPEWMTWGEADTDHAAEQMTRVYENQASAKAQGQQAAQDIRTMCGYDAVGQLMASQISQAYQTNQ